MKIIYNWIREIVICKYINAWMRKRQEWIKYGVGKWLFTFFQLQTKTKQKWGWVGNELVSKCSNVYICICMDSFLWKTAYNLFREWFRECEVCKKYFILRVTINMFRSLRFIFSSISCYKKNILYCGCSSWL